MLQDSLPAPIPIGTAREWYGGKITLTENGWKAEPKYTIHHRYKNWDYCRPWTYMVTIDTQHHDIPPMPITPDYALPEWLAQQYARQGHPHLFGELAKELNTEGKAEIKLNEFGLAVERHITEIPKFIPQVSIIKHIVMPNHVHFLIRVNRRLPDKKPLGHIINRFKSAVNKSFKEIVLGVPANTFMHIVQVSKPWAERPTMQALLCRQKHGGNGHKNPTTGFVFESSFHDRIPFSKEQLQNIINYITSNPQRLWEIVHNRQYFEKMAGWRITLPLLPSGGTGNVGRWWQYYPGGSVALTSDGGAQGLLEKIEITENNDSLPSMTMTFNAIGNRALIKAPEKLQIQCSRSMTDNDIETLVEDVLDACEHGVVIVSPCISEGEKRVARAVMDAGYQLIVIFPKGIPPKTAEYKPYGKYFDACANGQLLILSPWEFQHNKTKLSRWQCLMLNDIAAQIATIV